MLATLTDRRFSDPNWIFEHKLDGERCLAFKQGQTIRLLSRNKQRLNNTYPEIVDALEAAGDHDWVIDGEVVAFDGNRTSFARLQGRIGIKDPEEARRSGIPVFTTCLTSYTSTASMSPVSPSQTARASCGKLLPSDRLSDS